MQPANVAAVVEVWVAPLDVGPPALGWLIASLHPAERERAARYRSARDARRFSVARGWLRHVLGSELGTGPAAVPITGVPGKPRLEGGAEPCFNLSHAGELALIAVAGGEVGVDVEHAASGSQVLDGVELACTSAEAAGLWRLPPEERSDAFLCRWTAKEAYLKATGEGLTVPPHRVEVGEARAGGGAWVGVVGDPGPNRWWVRQLRPAPGYVGAVAAEGRDWRVELRSTAELVRERWAEQAEHVGS